jgi:hypothetical protein
MVSFCRCLIRYYRQSVFIISLATSSTHAATRTDTTDIKENDGKFSIVYDQVKTCHTQAMLGISDPAVIKSILRFLKVRDNGMVPWNEHVCKSFFRFDSVEAINNEMYALNVRAGYPEHMFSSHSLRVGWVTTTILKVMKDEELSFNDAVKEVSDKNEWQGIKDFKSYFRPTLDWAQQFDQSQDIDSCPISKLHPELAEPSGPYQSEHISGGDGYTKKFLATVIGVYEAILATGTKSLKKKDKLPPKALTKCKILYEAIKDLVDLDETGNITVRSVKDLLVESRCTKLNELASEELRKVSKDRVQAWVTRNGWEDLKKKDTELSDKPTIKSVRAWVKTYTTVDGIYDLCNCIGTKLRAERVKPFIAACNLLQKYGKKSKGRGATAAPVLCLIRCEDLGPTNWQTFEVPPEMLRFFTLRNMPKKYIVPSRQLASYDAQICPSYRLLIGHLGKRKYRRSNVTILIGGVRYNLEALDEEQKQMLYAVDGTSIGLSSIDPEMFRGAELEADHGHGDGFGSGESSEQVLQEWHSTWGCFESEQNPQEANAEVETLACEEVALLSIPWNGDSSDEEETIGADEGVCLECLGSILMLCKSEITPSISEKLDSGMTTLPVSLTIVVRRGSPQYVF